LIDPSDETRFMYIERTGTSFRPARSVDVISIGEPFAFLDQTDPALLFLARSNDVSARIGILATIVCDAVGEIDNDFRGSSTIVGLSGVVAAAGGWGSVMGGDSVPGFGGGLTLGDATLGCSVGHGGGNKERETKKENGDDGVMEYRED
jgi:hypothetical protein